MTKQELEQILALPAGYELDILVAEKVLRWKPGGLGGDDANYWWCNPPCFGVAPHSLQVTRTPRFSTDIAAAWMVFMHHRMASQILCYNISSPREHPDLIEIDELGYARQWLCTSQGIPVMAPTAPLAICRAALLTVLSREVIT